MGTFIQECNNIFPGLNKAETILIATNNNLAHVVIVDSIIIHNMIEQSIRINLYKKRIDNGVEIVMNYTKLFEIKGRGTVDLISALNLNCLKLYYQFTPTITEQLIITSTNSVQIFDCEINYNIIKEL